MTLQPAQQQPALQTVERLLQQAIAHHQAGRLLEAGQLYQTILQSRPDHPEANHNLGMIAVQAQQPAAGLPYFTAALDAEPTRGQYWLDYIDALFQAGQHEDARAVLALARRQGLQGDGVDALAARMGSGTPGAAQSGPAPGDVEDVSQAAENAGAPPSPREIDALVALFGEGRYTEVAVLAQGMTERFPQHAFGWKTLGVVFKVLGRNLDALEPMRKAAALAPDDVEAQYNLGVALQELGRLDEAEASYRRALGIDPVYADARLNLGAILARLGRLDEAEACFRRALQLNPDHAAAHDNLGVTLQRLGRLEAAEESIRNALRINPDHAAAHTNLGVVLHDQGRLGEADAHFQMALQLNPEDARAYDCRGTLLCHLGRLNEAETSYRKALQIAPQEAGLHINLGKLLRYQERPNEAEASFRRALEISPDDVRALNQLGLALQDLGRLDKAEGCFRGVLRTQPDNAGVMSNLGQVLLSLGRLDEAEACFRQALRIKPDHAPLHSNLLYVLMLSGAADAQAAFAEHVRFGEQFEPQLRPHWPRHTLSRDPERCLRIGFVSADFYNHAVASFIEPVLTHLSSRPQLSLHAYYNHFVNDNVTQRLRGLFAHWHPVAGLSDAALAEKIRADGIDILIDLAGHTAKNRLLTFARKPAPVQASWIGYPATTGLQSIDYYLADRFLLPPGRLDDQFTEKIVRLPALAPFLPSEFAPPVNPLPALSNAYVTFGSFNRPNKLSRAVIALWSQLLRALPDSRMLLGGMPEKGQCDALIEWFAQEGIERNRLDFHPRSGMEGYLSLHRQVDICLDAFPYNGGTTTNHALWMGVPTLTLAGESLPGRVGVAILSQAGLQDFVVERAEDFVARGLYWADHLSDLARLRAGLRERLVQSPLRKPEFIAAGLNDALRTMWRRWCAGLPAETFDVPVLDSGSMKLDGTHDAA